MRIVLSLYSTVLLLSVPIWGQEDILDDDAWLGSLLNVEDPIFGVGADELSESADTEKFSELESLSAAWSFDANVALGLGWRENALLAESSPVSSEFGQLEADLFAMRPRGNGNVQLLGLLYSEYRYYDQVPGLDDEHLSVGQIEVDYRVVEDLTLGAIVEGLYSKQAFDASEQEFDPQAATVSVWRPEVGTSLDYSLWKQSSLGLGIRSGQAYYDQEGEDYEFWEGEVEWSQDFGEEHRLLLSASWGEDRYDERVERVSIGFLSGDIPLKLSQSRWGVDWEWRPSARILQRFRSSVSFEEEDDEVGDYYEREQLRLRQRIAMRLGVWDIDLSVGYSEIDYLHRPKATFEDEMRAGERWSWGVDVSRPLGERWGLFLRFDGTDRQSNVEGLSYRDNTVIFGCQFRGEGES